MSGPSVHQHAFPKKRFQAAVVAAIDQHAGAISQIADRVEAQGGVLADLSVARDQLLDGARVFEGRLNDQRDKLIRCQTVLQRGTLWTRLRWLLTGK